MIQIKKIQWRRISKEFEYPNGTHYRLWLGEINNKEVVRIIENEKNECYAYTTGDGIFHISYKPTVLDDFLTVSTEIQKRFEKLILSLII